MVLLTVYRGLTDLSAPLVHVMLRRRLARGKEDPARLGERIGRPGRPRPTGPLVWMHGASVGESLALLPLIQALLRDRPDLSVLCTTGTVSSARLLAQRLPARACHQFIPVDRAAYVRRFLDHWRPDLLMVAESEFWPNLIIETHTRAVPLVLVNGRVSDRSFRTWRRFAPGLMKGLLHRFSLTLAQSDADAERLRILGADPVHSPGNLKFTADPAPVDEDVLQTALTMIGTRPCWLALSTHPGDEALVARVHRSLAPRLPGLLTIVMPRHAPRGNDARADMEAEGVTVAQRSQGATLDTNRDVYLADTMGEVGLFCRLAPVVVMGKSLLGDGGGQNPLEPARLGAAVVFGPHMENFRDISQRMLASGAARSIVDEQDLTRVLETLLTEAAIRDAIGRAGQAFATGEVHVLNRVLNHLSPLLDTLAPMPTTAASNHLGTISYAHP